MGGIANSLGSLVGGVVDAGKGLFGSKESNQTNQNSSQFMNFQQPDIRAVRGQQGVLTNTLRNLAQQANTYAGQAQGFTPTLNTNFGPGVNLVAPGSGGLDSTAQRLVAQEQSRQAAALAAQQRQIGQQFGGANPGVARILQQQASSLNRLQQNPLSFAANQEMAQRQALQNQTLLQQSQNNLGLQQAANQAALQQQGAGLQGLQNAFGFNQAGASAQTDLLNTLMKLAQMFGSQETQSSQSSSGRKGGLF